MPYIFSKITLLSVLLCWPPEHTTDSAAVKLCHGPLIPSLYITTVSLFFSVRGVLHEKCMRVCACMSVYVCLQQKWEVSHAELKCFGGKSGRDPNTVLMLAAQSKPHGVFPGIPGHRTAT